MKANTKNLLQGIRTGLGYTQEAIGEILGIAADTYGKKERGKIPFTIREARIIARVLDLTPEQYDEIFCNGELFLSKGNNAGNIFLGRESI